MNEALFWQIIPQPVIAAIAIFAFVPAPWAARARGASVAFLVALGIGVFAVWLRAQGVPGWAGWFIALPLAGFMFWRWARLVKERKPGGAEG